MSICLKLSIQLLYRSPNKHYSKLHSILWIKPIGNTCMHGSHIFHLYFDHDLIHTTPSTCSVCPSTRQSTWDPTTIPSFNTIPKMYGLRPKICVYQPAWLPGWWTSYRSHDHGIDLVREDSVHLTFGHVYWACRVLTCSQIPVRYLLFIFPRTTNDVYYLI